LPVKIHDIGDRDALLILFDQIYRRASCSLVDVDAFSLTKHERQFESARAIAKISYVYFVV
jgi:hypothetical protein